MIARDESNATPASDLPEDGTALTLAEARAKSRCRVCGAPVAGLHDEPGWKERFATTAWISGPGVLLLDYGREFAHRACLYALLAARGELYWVPFGAAGAGTVARGGPWDPAGVRYWNSADEWSPQAGYLFPNKETAEGRLRTRLPHKSLAEGIAAIGAVAAARAPDVDDDRLRQITEAVRAEYAAGGDPLDVRWLLERRVTYRELAAATRELLLAAASIIRAGRSCPPAGGGE